MRLTLRFPIKGLYYYAADALWPHLSTGKHFKIQTEPDNPYDANAVQLLWRTSETSALIGYIPRQLAKILAQIYSANEIENLDNRISFLWQQGKWQEIELQMTLDLPWHKALQSVLLSLWLRKKHQWQRFRRKKSR